MTLASLLFALIGVSLVVAGELRVFKEATPMTYDEYLTIFDYVARKQMRINSKELMALLKEDKASSVPAS